MMFMDKDIVVCVICRGNLMACSVYLKRWALYTHCFNPQINLCISTLCNVPYLNNQLGIPSSISTFLSALPKRVAVLNTVISEADSLHRKRQLKSLYATKWVNNHDSFITKASSWSLTEEKILTVLWGIDDSTCT